MLSTLPSYTQLGMAALLPNKALYIDENKKAYIDGSLAAGKENREKFLKNTCTNAICINADDLLDMNNKSVKTLVKDHDVIYVYHDQIDNNGEHNENKLFEYVDLCLNELRKLVTTLASGNASNILITADHGFIYQDLDVDKKIDFIDNPLSKEDADKTSSSHRFIISAKRVNNCTGFHFFKSSDLGLSGSADILIPKAIQRIKQQGNKTGKYCHGGATLQETVIPVIKINKTRTDSNGQVEVSLISNEKLITTGQIKLSFYQESPITDKIKSTKLRIGFYTDKRSDTPCSNIFEYVFCSDSSDVKDREYSFTFMFRKDIPGGNLYLRMDRLGDDGIHFLLDANPIEFTYRKTIIDRDFDF